MIEKVSIRTETPIKVGDKVRCGLVSKGGAGFVGTVIHIDGKYVILRSETTTRYGHREFHGLLENCTKYS